MLIANPADQMIYYYSEGMAAPMGNFQNYKREPRAVMVVDRSLREESLGVYATNMRLPKDGTYDVSFLLDSPRVVHCFEATAGPTRTRKQEPKAGLRVEYLNEEKSPRAGENYKLRFKLTDTATGQPKDGLEGRARARSSSRPASGRSATSPHRSAAASTNSKSTSRRTGVYMVFVESQSQGVDFRQLPY